MSADPNDARCVAARFNHSSRPLREFNNACSRTMLWFEVRVRHLDLRPMPFLRARTTGQGERRRFSMLTRCQGAGANGMGRSQTTTRSVGERPKGRDARVARAYTDDALGLSAAGNAHLNAPSYVSTITAIETFRPGMRAGSLAPWVDRSVSTFVLLQTKADCRAAFQVVDVSSSVVKRRTNDLGRLIAQRLSDSQKHSGPSTP
jgi:hypothetical protein